MILGGGKVEVRETAVPDHLLPLLRAELDLGLKVNSYQPYIKHLHLLGGKRSVTPRGRPGDGKKRKRKRKRERDRERLRRRGGLAESDKKVLEEENATMRAKLADRLYPIAILINMTDDQPTSRFQVVQAKARRGGRGGLARQAG